ALACFVELASLAPSFHWMRALPAKLIGRLIAPMGLGYGLIVGLCLVRALPPGRARVVASVAAGVAVGQAGASPAFGGIWGGPRALVVEALAAVAVVALIAQGRPVEAEPVPPAPHQIARRVLLDALLAGAVSGF